MRYFEKNKEDRKMLIIVVVMCQIYLTVNVLLLVHKLTHNKWCVPGNRQQQGQVWLPCFWPGERVDLLSQYLYALWMNRDSAPAQVTRWLSWHGMEILIFFLCQRRSPVALGQITRFPNLRTEWLQQVSFAMGLSDILKGPLHVSRLKVCSY